MLIREPRMVIQPSTTTLAGVHAGTESAVLPALMAMLLGFAIIGIVGFSTIDVVHNAAHDTRHSNAFPCH
jgi:cobalt transporter subunit CbtB